MSNSNDNDSVLVMLYKDNVLARIYKQQTAIGKAVVDGKWDPEKVADHLQFLIDNPPRIGKFALLVDLGTITVPNDYNHATCLAKFYNRHQGGKNKSFHGYNTKINDKNFPNPTRVLKPGDRLHVRSFKQVAGGTITSEERMAFLATKKAIHTGAQGASLVFDQKRNLLPRGVFYDSYDEKDRLWVDASGYHRVPRVSCMSCRLGDYFQFVLGGLEGIWYDDGAFFCFTEVEEGFPDDQVRIQGIDPLN